MNDNEQKLINIAQNAIDIAHEANDAAREANELAEQAFDDSENVLGEEQAEFAWNLFEYNTTLAAKLAVGHGFDRERVAMSLHSLADAIANPTSVAEDMSPVHDANTLLHLLL
jgi:hypothetical protein